MDKIINTFFTQRYDYILECANNILKLIKRQDLKYELVNDAFFYISTNKEKLKEVLETGKIEEDGGEFSWAGNWMKKVNKFKGNK